MNKVVKISLGLTLLFTIYACNASSPSTPNNINVNPKPTTAFSSNPNPQATGAGIVDNNLKPYSRPKYIPNSTILPSSSSTPMSLASSTSTINTQPSGNTGTTSDCSCSTGTTSDVKEMATFNGKVLNPNGVPIDGASVSAKSIGSGFNWVGETQSTVNGAYVFRNAPIGARVEITVKKDGWVTRTLNVVLKSNLQGDPLANVFDFSKTLSLYQITNLTVNLFDLKGESFKSGANVKVESLDKNVFFSESYFVNESLNLNNVPENTDLKITVRYFGDKIKERFVTSRYIYERLIVNFGGSDSLEDKSFAISNIKEQELDSSINKFTQTNNEKFSTFSVDTDTASYTLMRDSILRAGSLPGKESVRIEEYVNYFDYNYPKPQDAKFLINTELAPSPFDKTNTKHIFRIGIQGQEISTKNRKDSILTFLIDTSGSMADNNKLNLVKNSLKIMLKQLKPTDKVAIVEYNFSAKTILKHTLVRDESKIVEAIDSLKAISSTDIEKGLRMAFKESQESYDPDYLNRIIICSDGINSSEIKNPEEFVNQIRKEYETKVSISALGVGFTNYNDTFLETIASKNDGYYSYIDNVKEAVRLFVESSTDTLQVIAKDAKIQIEFNPKNVLKYRLIGYDNKVLANQDFRNDNVDAGEIGSNHSVTALYEIELNPEFNGKIADVYMRYKDITNNNLPLENSKEVFSNDVRSSYELSSPSFKQATTIALFGEILRKSYWSFDNSFKDVLNYTKNIQKDEKINEFISIVEKSDNIITK